MGEIKPRLKLTLAATIAALAGVLLAGIAVAGQATDRKAGIATQTGTGTQTGTTSTAADRRVMFSAGAKKSQKAGSAIKVQVRCAEICQVTAGGQLFVQKPSPRAREARRSSFVLKQASSSLGAGQTKILKLKLPKPARKAALKSVHGGGKASAKVSVDARDLAGNRGSKKLKVRLR
jgi:hypothetical protein